jgi:hypothetical protein
VKQSETGNLSFIDIDHPAEEPDDTPNFEIPIPNVAENVPQSPIQHRPSILRNETEDLSSPAFMKRARLSYGSFIEDYGVFEDDGTVAGKGRKRAKFSRDSGRWRYSSRSRSPEVEKKNSSRSVSPQLEGHSTMIDEGCQTEDLGYSESANRLTNSPKQASAVGREVRPELPSMELSEPFSTAPKLGQEMRGSGTRAPETVISYSLDSGVGGYHLDQQIMLDNAMEPAFQPQGDFEQAQVAGQNGLYDQNVVQNYQEVSHDNLEHQYGQWEAVVGSYNLQAQSVSLSHAQGHLHHGYPDPNDMSHDHSPLAQPYYEIDEVASSSAFGHPANIAYPELGTDIYPADSGPSWQPQMQIQRPSRSRQASVPRATPINAPTSRRQNVTLHRPEESDAEHDEEMSEPAGVDDDAAGDIDNMEAVTERNLKQDRNRRVYPEDQESDNGDEELEDYSLDGEDDQLSYEDEFADDEDFDEDDRPQGHFGRYDNAIENGEEDEEDEEMERQAASDYDSEESYEEEEELVPPPVKPAIKNEPIFIDLLSSDDEDGAPPPAPAPKKEPPMAAVPQPKLNLEAEDEEDLEEEFDRSEEDTEEEEGKEEPKMSPLLIDSEDEMSEEVSERDIELDEEEESEYPLLSDGRLNEHEEEEVSELSVDLEEAEEEKKEISDEDEEENEASQLEPPAEPVSEVEEIMEEQKREDGGYKDEDEVMDHVILHKDATRPEESKDVVMEEVVEVGSIPSEEEDGEKAKISEDVEISVSRTGKESGGYEAEDESTDRGALKSLSSYDGASDVPESKIMQTLRATRRGRTRAKQRTISPPPIRGSPTKANAEHNFQISSTITKSASIGNIQYPTLPRAISELSENAFIVTEGNGSSPRVHHNNMADSNQLPTPEATQLTAIISRDISFTASFDGPTASELQPNTPHQSENELDQEEEDNFPTPSKQMLSQAEFEIETEQVTAEEERMVEPQKPVVEIKSPLEKRVTRSAAAHAVLAPPTTPSRKTKQSTVTPQSNRYNTSFSIVIDSPSTPLPGQDASALLADEALDSPSKPENQVPETALRAQLTQNLRKNLPSFTPLKSLRTKLDKKLDVLVIATTKPPAAERAKHGPRHYFMRFNVTDPSVAPAGVVEIQVFRPYKDALPDIEVGDGILLRDFKVKSEKGRGFALRSEDSSSWAVFKDGKAAEMRGPPVEFGQAEEDQVSCLREWFGSLDDVAREKIRRAGEETSPNGKGKVIRKVF